MDTAAFLGVIDLAPLVSIDIILENPEGKILLGKRVNKPAQGFWFVPGGRIRKNETLEAAMTRISEAELGFRIDLAEAVLLGAYDHIYEDNFHSEPLVNTHYVALGHKFYLSNSQSLTFDSQHSDTKWWSVEALMASEKVHENTKKYFRK